MLLSYFPPALLASMIFQNSQLRPTDPQPLPTSNLVADFVGFASKWTENPPTSPHPSASMILLLVFKLLCNPPLLECGWDLGFSSNQQNMAEVMDAAPPPM